MLTMCFLDKLDNKLMVRYVTTDFNEPVKVTMWWPIGSYDRNTVESFCAARPGMTVDEMQGDMLEGLADGVYLHRDSRTYFRLADGGATKAVKVEREPIPRPKSKVEVRWRHGKWEKYLKREGWVGIGVGFEV